MLPRSVIKMVHHMFPVTTCLLRTQREGKTSPSKFYRVLMGQGERVPLQGGSMFSSHEEHFLTRPKPEGDRIRG